VSSSDPNLLVLFRPIPKTRYGGAVEVKRAADLYAQGWTLRQIGAGLGRGYELFEG
jgi:hypothetical protein